MSSTSHRRDATPAAWAALVRRVKRHMLMRTVRFCPLNVASAHELVVGPALDQLLLAADALGRTARRRHSGSGWQPSLPAGVGVPDRPGLAHPFAGGAHFASSSTRAPCAPLRNKRANCTTAHDATVTADAMGRVQDVKIDWTPAAGSRGPRDVKSAYGNKYVDCRTHLDDNCRARS